MEVIQIVSIVFAVLIGYAFGVTHARAAMRDAIEQLRKEGKDERRHR